MAIIVPTRNKAQFLVRTVSSMIVAAESYRGLAGVWVVDNGSTDGTIQLLADTFGDTIKVVCAPGVHVGAVRNVGAQAAEGRDVFVFLDSDIVVPADHLQRIADAFEVSGAAAVGCRVGLPADPTRPEREWHELHAPRNSGQVHHLNSGNLAINAKVFTLLRGFDEQLVSGEDAELCQRINARGLGLYQDLRLQVEHLDNPRTFLDFMRKEFWRGRGMSGTAGRGKVDLPYRASQAHLTFIVIAVGLVAAAVIGAAKPIGIVLMTGLLLPLIVPSAALGLRLRRGGRSSSLWMALLLYTAYFTARSMSLFAQTHAEHLEG